MENANQPRNVPMKILVSEEQLRDGVRRMAGEIQEHYEGRPLTVVGVLIGSVVLLGDLIRLLSIPLRAEMVQARNARGNSPRPGPLVIDEDLLSSAVRGRDVLLVDDIFHTGRTLWELIPQIDDLGAASDPHTHVLLEKQGQSQVELKPDFIGFPIPDEFVVGYGLDFHDRYRNLPYVAALDPRI